MRSTISVVKEHAVMSVKTDANGSVEQINIFAGIHYLVYVNVPESTQSCDG